MKERPGSGKTIPELKRRELRLPANDAGWTASLSEAQLAAIDHMRTAARSVSEECRSTAAAVLRRSGLTTCGIDDVIRGILRHARVTLNFHPDRPLSGGYTVAEGLLRDGVYRSQFETGVTNGSRTAFPGGDRDRWERTLFGGAYHSPGDRDVERPKYGALNVMHYADGAAPRFGSCYFRLRPHMLGRCTFTFGDSHAGPKRIGTSDAFEPLAAALLESCESSGSALGAPDTDVVALVRRLLGPGGGAHASSGAVGRALDDYIEAQIHGPLDLSADVEALVADPSFRGTPVGDGLEALCARYGISFAWHPGFRLAVDSVPDDFRGPAMPPFARRIDRDFAAVPGWLDAAVIGRAAAALHFRPAIWRDWGTPDETFQHVKQLWHCLVRYGEPIR